MRNKFFPILYQLMLENPDIWVITGDLGFGGFDKVREDFPDRFINVGAAETTMMNVAVGLALEGKVPVCYSITPFLLYRPFEVWRTYIDRESIPVIGIGSGRDSDYHMDGFSHYAGDDHLFMDQFKNIRSVWPQNESVMKRTLEEAIESGKPYYINLKKG